MCFEGLAEKKQRRLHLSRTRTVLKALQNQPDDSDRTGMASLRCALACVCPGGSAE